MAKVITIHPHSPQQRLVNQVAEMLEDGKVIILPTDSGFSLTCLLGATDAIRRIRLIRSLPEQHFFTLMCHNISHANEMADFDKAIFKCLNANTPGPCTFILKASQRIPKKMLHKSRKTVGIRIPHLPLLQQLIQTLDAPIMGVSLYDYETSQHFFDAITTDQVNDQFGNQVDAIIDTGSCLQHVSTIVDCTTPPPKIVRQGYGNAVL